MVLVDEEELRRLRQTPTTSPTQSARQTSSAKEKACTSCLRPRAFAALRLDIIWSRV